MENPKKQKQKAAKKKKQYKPPKGLSAAELEKRLKQREQALNRRISSLSSPQLRPILRAENSKLRGTQAVLAALIDPDNAPPMRLPGGGKPTFVVKLRATLAASIVPASEDVATKSIQLTPNSGFAVKRRDPRCSLIVYRFNATGASVYQALSDSGTTVTGLDSNGYRIIGAMAYSSGFERHGDFYLPWVFADQRTRVWFQSESARPSTVTMSGLTAATSYTLTLHAVLNGVALSLILVAISDGAGIVVFTVTGELAGYCAFRLAATAAIGVYLGSSTMSLEDNSQGMVQHLAAPQFWQEITSVDSIRTNAASLMYSDRTASQFSQGDICSYQASGGDVWEKMLAPSGPAGFLSCDPYGQVPSFNNGYKGPYKKGKYIPLKFVDDPREQQMRNISDSSEPYEIAPIVQEESTDYLFIGFNFGLSQAGAPTPMGEWTAVEGDEGETESQWKETRVPDMHPDVLKEAKYCFSQVKCDFENPSHLSKIWSWVKANAPHILETVGRAVGQAGPYGAAAAAGLGTVSGIIRGFAPEAR